MRNFMQLLIYNVHIIIRKKKVCIEAFRLFSFKVDWKKKSFPATKYFHLTYFEAELNKPLIHYLSTNCHKMFTLVIFIHFNLLLQYVFLIYRLFLQLRQLQVKSSTIVCGFVEFVQYLSLCWSDSQMLQIW